MSEDLKPCPFCAPPPASWTVLLPRRQPLHVPVPPSAIDIQRATLRVDGVRIRLGRRWRRRLWQAVAAIRRGKQRRVQPDVMAAVQRAVLVAKRRQSRQDSSASVVE